MVLSEWNDDILALPQENVIGRAWKPTFVDELYHDFARGEC